MLMKIGPVICELRFNIDRVSRSAAHDYAVKPVVGAMPPLEDVGEGEDSLTVSGRLLPGKLGGLTELESLRGAKETGTPQFVMRGDGVALGFFAITGLNEEHSFLDRAGVGQVVDLTITMRKTGTPAAGDFFAGLLSLF
jgi:phage protein U